MFESTQDKVERQVTELIRPQFDDLFRVIYDPAFPLPDGSTFAWFQVIFAVGPADDSDARVQVFERFFGLLPVLAAKREVQKAGTVALRARRRVPSQSEPDHPPMYIECAWAGAVVAEMRRTRNFAAWHSVCKSFINRFDRNDPLTKLHFG